MLCCGGLLLVTLAAPGPKEKPPEPSVVGEWVAERNTFAGNDRPLPQVPVRYVFAPDGTWATYRGDKKHPGEHQTYTVDPAKSPAAIDLGYDEIDADRDPAAQHQVVRGIYKVDGDRLTLCMAPAGRGRPTAFESTADKPTTLYVFKRFKKD
jgi:uncharacterized protein (TIGR03067 family)